MLSYNPIAVDDFDAHFNCIPMDRASDNNGADPKLFILVGWDRSTLVCCWSIVAHLMVFFVSGFQ